MPNKTVKYAQVHRLVFETFAACCLAPDEYIVTARDGNVGNAALENLTWMPKSEFHFKKVKRQRSERRLGHGGGNKLLSDDQVIEIRRRLYGPIPRGEVAKVAREYGVRGEVIRRIVEGLTYRHLL